MMEEKHTLNGLEGPNPHIVVNIDYKIMNFFHIPTFYLFR